MGLSSFVLGTLYSTHLVTHYFLRFRAASASKTVNSTETANEDNHDTIGVIALDATGSLAVGVSTSGLRHKIPGRVGDSPIPGSGGYANDEVLTLWLCTLNFLPPFDLGLFVTNYRVLFSHAARFKLEFGSF